MSRARTYLAAPVLLMVATGIAAGEDLGELDVLLTLGNSPCDSPEKPFSDPPPSDDELFREMLNEEYQRYILGAEEYLNCLNSESRRARAELKIVLDRYVDYFGEDAAIRY